MAKGIRALRNKLEEVDDALDELTTRPADVRVIEAAGESKEALDRIDRALQHFRCAGHQEGEHGDGTVVDLQAGLAVVTRRLTDALDALESSTAEVEIVSHVAAAREAQIDYSPVQLSASTSLSSGGRLGSTSSSAWSVARGRDDEGRRVDSNRTSVCSEALPVPQPQEEKEVLNVHTAVSPRLGVDSGLHSWSASDSWKSPFASPDPFLSMGFEAASSLLSGSSRDGTGSPFLYSQASTPKSPEFTNEHVVHSHFLSTMDAQVEATAEHEVKVEDMDDTQTIAFQAPESNAVEPTEASPPTIEDEITLVKPPYDDDFVSSTPSAPAEVTDIAVEECVPPQHLDEDSPSHNALLPPAEVVEASSEADQAENSTPSPSSDPRRENDKVANPEPQPTHEQLRKALETVLFQGRFDAAAPNLELDRNLRSEGRATDLNKPLPIYPTRAAPPPPPSSQRPRPPIPKGLRRRAVSHNPQPRYRIVNPDVPRSDFIRRDSQSSEDLYTTSRPTSLRLPPQRVRSKSVELLRDREVPRVVVIPPTREQTLASIRSKPRAVEPPSIVLVPSSHDIDTIGNEQEKMSSMIAPSPRTDRHRVLIAGEEGMQPPLPPRPKPKLARHRVPVPGHPPVRSSHSFNDAGLEIDQRGVQIDDKELVTRRISADEMMLDKEVFSESHWKQHAQARMSLNIMQQTPRPVAGAAVQEFYGVDEESELEVRLDEERANSIMHYWNESRWDRAEEHILAHLERQVVLGNSHLARRMRHLLGVIASLQGQWHKALLLFISVLNGPITPTSKLDAGDCAAAYWMADVYTLLNRRVEAILAYAIAERAPLFRNEIRPRLHKCIRAELAECLMGTGRSTLTPNYHIEVRNRDLLAEDSILDPKYITSEAASFFFETEPWHPDDYSGQSFSLDPNNSRAQSLWHLAGGSWLERHKLQLSLSAFENHGAWPLALDPYFSVANVARGRLLLYECDLVQVFSSNASAKIPRSGPVGLGRIDSFTCADLQWLILTLRDCLTMFEMEWSEVATVQGTWFMARYSFMQNHVATTHFFSLALFRQSMRSGYRVELCPGGMCSARVSRHEIVYDRGVHQEEAKRVRKLVREYLDAAAKRQKSQNDAGSSVALDSPRPSMHHRASSLAMSMSFPAVPPKPRNRPNSYGGVV